MCVVWVYAYNYSGISHTHGKDVIGVAGGSWVE